MNIDFSYHPSTMRRHTIRRFNPFNLQHGSDQNIHATIQEIVYYAESRFWCIVNKISKAEPDRQSWMQKLLHRELLVILSYVGISSAIGQTVDVPIIVRSLADSMAMLQGNDLPIPFDPEFLTMLDIGAHDKDNKSRVVTKYEYAWWNGRKPRSLAMAEILDHSSIQKCLDLHEIPLASTCRGVVLTYPPAVRGPTMPVPANVRNVPNTVKFLGIRSRTYLRSIDFPIQCQPLQKINGTLICARHRHSTYYMRQL
ncbi:hypothetical protein BYT27DRAFT_7253203 [Phlegmacium glaucopus]|nr:hypothetical protein BYT27DRAFT_7253203 [Phlegmacium glaucopus]